MIFEYCALAVLGFTIFGLLLILREERELNAKMHLELMNRIQAPDTAVWKSLTNDLEKSVPEPSVGLEPALSSEAEEGEMHLVGKVVQGDFDKGKKNES